MGQKLLIMISKFGKHTIKKLNDLYYQKHYDLETVKKGKKMLRKKERKKQKLKTITATTPTTKQSKKGKKIE